MTNHVKTNGEQLVADLAWEFCEKSRTGQKVRMDDYLGRCPDRKSRVAFKELVNTDFLVDLAVRDPEV